MRKFAYLIQDGQICLSSARRVAAVRPLSGGGEAFASRGGSEGVLFLGFFWSGEAFASLLCSRSRHDPVDWVIKPCSGNTVFIALLGGYINNLIRRMAQDRRSPSTLWLGMG